MGRTEGLASPDPEAPVVEEVVDPETSSLLMSGVAEEAVAEGVPVAVEDSADRAVAAPLEFSL
jgi:hypothetical protein